MESVSNSVPNPAKRFRSPEEKLTMLQEWQNGQPMAEVCRKYRVRSTQVYRWKKDLERSLNARSQLVPKTDVAALQRRLDDLERALGRKSLEVEMLKKVFETQGLRLPDGL